MKINKTIFRKSIIVIIVTILLISFRQTGIFFDNLNLSVYDAIIMAMSSLGLSKVNDYLSEKYANEE